VGSNEHRFWHDQRAGAQRGIQAAGQAKADQSCGTGGNQPFDRSRGPLGRAAAGCNDAAQWRGEAGFGGQTDQHRNAGEISRCQKPYATCGALPRRRLR
jgi:hypothetical protein